MTARFAFVTGIARSGTNLIGRMLAQHRDFAFAMDPYLPVLKWFRSSVAEKAVAEGQLPAAWSVPPSSPLDDYYFREDRQQLMEAIRSADLSLPFDEGQWELLQRDLENRAMHECADLVPHLAELRGQTYASIWEAGLNLIVRERGRGAARWAGVKELWCVEFIPHLLKAFPLSKAVIIVRDPRAVVASMLKMGEEDPSQQAQILSYARHWRKLAAFTVLFRSMPAIAERLAVICYEDLVTEPETQARDLCRFFDVAFDPAMLDVASFWDPSKQSAWEVNSSYKDAVSGIERDLATRWERYLPEDCIRLVDFLCGPEMALFGYQPRTGGRALTESDIPLQAFIESYGAKASWRSDAGDPLLDIGLEIARRALLASPERPESGLLKRCFLFELMYDCLREGPRMGQDIPVPT
jgi:hypothetical protein